MTTIDTANLTDDLRKRLLAAIDRIKERSFALITICNRADVAVRMGREDDGQALQAVVRECRRQLEQAEEIGDLLK